MITEPLWPFLKAREVQPSYDGACIQCRLTLDEFTRENPGEEPRSWMKLCAAFVERDPEWADDEDEQGETEAASVAVGIPRMVSWWLVELNDMIYDRESPEERYIKVLKHVERALNPSVSASAVAE